MDNQRESTMVVSGVGAADVVPDMAQIDVSLEVTDVNPSAAHTEVGSVARRVVAALDERGVGEADRRTLTVSLQPQYVHDGTTSPTIVGYTATHGLRLRIEPLSMISEVLDVLVDAAGDALRLGGLALGSRDTDGAQASAETAAVTDARRRAQRLADAAGVELGPVIAVRHESLGTAPRAVGLGWASDSVGAPVQPGTAAVHAQVTVTFALQD